MKEKQKTMDKRQDKKGEKVVRVKNNRGHKWRELKGGEIINEDKRQYITAGQSQWIKDMSAPQHIETHTNRLQFKIVSRTCR